MGFSSYFVPGLGQIISGEVGRGLAFMGGTYVTFGTGLGLGASSINENGDRADAQMWEGLGLMLGSIGINIWSVVDKLNR